MSDTPDTRDAAVEGAFGSSSHPRPPSRPELLEQRLRLRPLFNATVFSEAEAGIFDVPIADDEPEWLAMPAPFRVERRPWTPRRW